MVKFLNNELKSNGQMVFMDGEQSKYFGESVTIAKIDELATTNRINSEHLFCIFLDCRRNFECRLKTLKHLNYF